jgi:hypothetical protein
VLVVAHKVVSKAEGPRGRARGRRRLARAVELAAPWGKDPRHVEVVLGRAPRCCAPSGGADLPHPPRVRVRERGRRRVERGAPGRARAAAARPRRERAAPARRAPGAGPPS